MDIISYLLGFFINSQIFLTDGRRYFIANSLYSLSQILIPKKFPINFFVKQRNISTSIKLSEILKKELKAS